MGGLENELVCAYGEEWRCDDDELAMASFYGVKEVIEVRVVQRLILENMLKCWWWVSRVRPFVLRQMVKSVLVRFGPEKQASYTPHWTALSFSDQKKCLKAPRDVFFSVDFVCVCARGFLHLFALLDR